MTSKPKLPAEGLVSLEGVGLSGARDMSHSRPLGHKPRAHAHPHTPKKGSITLRSLNKGLSGQPLACQG